MTRTIEAIYENGVLRPLEPIKGLPEQSRLTITVETQEQETPLGEDPILKVVGTCLGGPKDGADQHDHYIYGNPKRLNRTSAG